jgi:hypothetical protein
MPKVKTKTKQEQLQDIVHDYMLVKGKNHIVIDDVAEWAISNGRFWQPQKSQKRMCKEAIAKALRSERHIDPQGRTVRTMHAYLVQDDFFPQFEWVDIRNAPPDKMQNAFSRRREGILADVMRHAQDVDSYNDNNLDGAQLKLFDYNFNTDLEEGKLPTTYDESLEFTDFDEDE